MISRHTQGRWTVGANIGRTRAIWAGQRIIAEVMTSITHGNEVNVLEAEHNAHLIAAAPAIQAALGTLLSRARCGAIPSAAEIDDAQEALRASLGMVVN